MPTGKLHKKKKQKRLKKCPAGYISSFYRNLADNVDNFFGSDFYGRIGSDDVQKVFKNISLPHQILLKVSKMTLIITLLETE